MKSVNLTTIKYFLIGFNVVLTISGLGDVIVGSLAVQNEKLWRPLIAGSSSSVVAPAIALITAGTVVFVLVVLGCYGAIKEHYKLLIMFTVVLFFIFIVELSTGIIAAANAKLDNITTIKLAVIESMLRYEKNDDDYRAWNWLQETYRCCGADSSFDWQVINSKFANALPGSCCKVSQNTTCANTESEAYQEGCYMKLLRKMRIDVLALTVFGIVGAFIVHAGYILGYLLTKAVKKENEVK